MNSMNKIQLRQMAAEMREHGESLTDRILLKVAASGHSLWFMVGGVVLVLVAYRMGGC